MDGLRRMVEKQVVGAIDQLGRRDDLNEGVHEARKHFKRIRAVLRLARGALPARTYRLENAFFRDQGRILSPVRDSAVLIETLDGLREEYSVRMAEGSFECLRDSLLEEHRALLAKLTLDPELLGGMDVALRESQSRVRDWRFRENGTALFAPGLRRIYARGREEMKAILERPSTEGIHAWRKRVKYLWHHCQILTPAWPGPIGALARECDRLADLLGKDHDLAMLTQSPHLLTFHETDRGSAKLLKDLAYEARLGLYTRAVLEGEKIFLERPGRFVSRIEGYCWSLWSDGDDD